MIRTKRSNDGQSTAEYAIVIALVLGALVGMQTYVRRAINARIADASDNSLPDTLKTGATATRRYQFEPDYTHSDFTTNSQLGRADDTTAPATVTMAPGAGGISTVSGDFGSKTNRSGTQTECGVGTLC